MCEGEDQRPSYQENTNNSSHGNGGDTFEIIEEGSILQQSPWELSSTGNKDAEWLQKEVIVTHAPPPLDEAWQLESSEAVIVLLKKINWSEPGPERLVDYWWK